MIDYSIRVVEDGLRLFLNERGMQVTVAMTPAVACSLGHALIEKSADCDMSAEREASVDSDEALRILDEAFSKIRSNIFERLGPKR